MPDLSASIQEMLNGRLVRVGHLCEFRVDDPKYLWDGHRTLDTLDGKTWEAARQLGSIDGLEEEDDNLQSSEMKFTLSGVDAELLQSAVAVDRSLYIGRLAFVWLQFFDADWQPLDNPVAYKCRIIDGIEVSHSVSDDGPEERSLSLTAQNMFYGRSTPPASNYSPRDQQFRSPGDRGLEFVSDVVKQQIHVPW